MRTRIFYSGESLTESELQKFCLQNNLELTAKSLLGFQAIPFEIKHDFDVVFISSIRSYDYFISQYKSGNKLTLAVIGESTSVKINLENSSIEFIGDNAGDPAQVAKDFKIWLGERRVLFPLSSRSNRSVSSEIPDDQKEEIICYETVLRSEQIPQQDYYVFTSPSNVEAFLLKNEFPSDSRIIAWGKTTESYLRKREISVFRTLKTSSESELITLLKELL